MAPQIKCSEILKAKCTIYYIKASDKLLVQTMIVGSTCPAEHTGQSGQSEWFAHSQPLAGSASVRAVNTAGLQAASQHNHFYQGPSE